MFINHHYYPLKTIIIVYNHHLINEPMIINDSHIIHLTVAYHLSLI